MFTEITDHQENEFWALLLEGFQICFFSDDHTSYIKHKRSDELIKERTNFRKQIWKAITLKMSSNPDELTFFNCIVCRLRLRHLWKTPLVIFFDYRTDRKHNATNAIKSIEWRIFCCLNCSSHIKCFYLDFGWFEGVFWQLGKDKYKLVRFKPLELVSTTQLIGLIILKPFQTYSRVEWNTRTDENERNE